MREAQREAKTRWERIRREQQTLLAKTNSKGVATCRFQREGHEMGTWWPELGGMGKGGQDDDSSSQA